MDKKHKKKILMLGKIYVNPEKIVILRSVIKRDFTVVWTNFGLCSWKIYLNIAHPTVLSFMVRVITSLTGVFVTFSLAGHIKLTTYSKVCQ